MLKLPKDLREFIGLRNSHEMHYLIVGGYAVAYHGFPRITGDIDLVMDASLENTRRLEVTLVAFGFGDWASPQKISSSRAWWCNWDTLRIASTYLRVSAELVSPMLGRRA